VLFRSPLFPMFNTASATFAIASPVFSILFAVTALSHMAWLGYGGWICGPFHCCTTSTNECKALSNVSNGWSLQQSRAGGAGAFLLISVFVLAVTIAVLLLAASKKWAGFFGTLASLSLFTSAATLWMSLFIAVGTPGAAISSDPLWLIAYAAVSALGGGFFALHAKANASGSVSDLKDPLDNPAFSNAVVASGGAYQAGGAAYSASASVGTYQPAPSPYSAK